jgi:hypothetical protein
MDAVMAALALEFRAKFLNLERLGLFEPFRIGEFRIFFGRKLVELFGFRLQLLI